MARNRRTGAEDNQIARNLTESLDAALSRTRQAEAVRRLSVSDMTPPPLSERLNAAREAYAPLDAVDRAEYAARMRARITNPSPVYRTEDGEWQERRFTLPNYGNQVDARRQMARWAELMRRDGWTVVSTPDGAVARRRVVGGFTAPGSAIWDGVGVGGVDASDAIKDVETMAMKEREGETTQEIVERAVCRSLASLGYGVTLEIVMGLYRKYRSFDLLLTVLKITKAHRCDIDSAERFLIENVSVGSGGELALTIDNDGARLTQVRDGFQVPLPGDVRRHAESTLEDQGSTASGFLND